MSGFVAAAQAGISAIPVNTTSKKPLVRWKEYQSGIAELLILQGWERADHNIAFVCGAVSGRLLALDFEAGFMDRFVELAARLREAGLYEVFEGWLAGYSESTPSGGLHALLRLEGSGPLDGNQKLAMDEAGGVLVETRGEGGYVIVAPSRNGGRGWELLAGGFDSIAYATLDEWAAVEAVLRSFDTSTPAPAPTVPTRSTMGFGDILRIDESWIDRIKATLPSMATVLDAHGWQPDGGRDNFGEHWTRPGKDPRHGHSASISAADRLWVHSSNAGLPVGVSLDVVDVLWCYETGTSQRPPTLEERTEWLQAQRPPAEVGAGAAPVEEVADLNLSPDFWQARRYLAHVHQAALALRLSPDAVWEGVKCFYAATIPWNHRLPGDGTVDYVSIVVGASGAGKSRAKHCAWRLLETCHDLTDVAFPVPVGSGEGMTEIYLDRDTDNQRRYKLRGVGFYADEGKFLLDIGARNGNTTMQAIKQMWSGELTGSVAATVERHRWLEPRAVRATLLISTTPDIAARFMAADYSDEGLPQRLSWAVATYDHPDQAPAWPGPLDVQVWDNHNLGDHLYPIDLAAELSTAIDKRLLDAARGAAQDDGLEGHGTYATLKTAAIHAHLDGRMDITADDWGLAQHDWEVTRRVRQHIQRSQLAGLADRNAALGAARAHQKIAEGDVFLERAIEALRRKLRAAKEPLTMRQAKDHLRHFSKRHQIDHREVIDAAISRGWVHRNTDGTLEPSSP